MEEKEMVSHPEHYNKGIEVYKFINSWDLNFNLGNVVKYVCRAPYKGTSVRDLEKAIQYLQFELERVLGEDING